MDQKAALLQMFRDTAGWLSPEQCVRAMRLHLAGAPYIEAIRRAIEGQDA